MSTLNGFSPQPKPEKKEKVKKPIAKVSSKKKFRCSDGEMVSQQQIEYRIAKIPPHPFYDRDHTISVARCKKLNKTELSWHPANIEYSTRTQHMEWESYRSGVFEEHDNVVERMLFVKEHDPETFEKRKACISNYLVLQAIG